jgi:hypothetical protein
MAWRSAYESTDALDLVKMLADHEARASFTELKEKLMAELGYLGDGKWLVLQSFLLGSYWPCLWIVKEVALAPNNMLMLCGRGLNHMEGNPGWSFINTYLSLVR